MSQPGPILLEIVPLGGADGERVAWLARELEALSGVPASVVAGGDASDAVPASTARCDADRLLDLLVANAAARPGVRRGWLLGVTDRELYSAERGSVFGAAALGGGCALVSTAGLAGETDDVILNRALERSRLRKEAVHELGHAAGLEHCPDADCVMFPSAGLNATDRKACEFCRRCSQRGAELGIPCLVRRQHVS